jgi:hypothetical protein
MCAIYNFSPVGNQLRVFVSLSRHKCRIGLNRERIFWNFNKETDSVSSVNRDLCSEIRYTLPVVDGFYWSTLQTVAGLRFKTTGGSEIEGGLPTVDDGTNGELTVRWPIHSPDGEVVITFNETCVSIYTTGNVKDGWLLELTSDKKASLPFRKIDRQKLSCTYKGAPYAISAIRGVFTNEPGFDLRIIPQDNRIVLDFSSRLSL